MKAKTRIIIIIGLFIIVLFSCGLYLNYQLDFLLQSPGSFSAGNLTDNEVSLQGENGITDRSGQAAAKAGIQSEAKPHNTRINSSRAENENLVNDVQKKVGQPIEKIDMLKASVILIRKLSAEDISYLSQVAMQDSYNQKDYQHSQEILLNKLSAEDINTLKKLGKKYGNDLKILNPNGK